MLCRKLMLAAGLMVSLSVLSAPVRIDENTTYTTQAELDAAADGIEIADGVVLTFNPGSGKSLAVNHAISGAGGIAVTSGTVTFTVASSYSGGTAVSSAVVLCSVADALGAGEVVIDRSATSTAYVAYTQGSTTEGAAEVKNAFRLKNVSANKTGTDQNSALRFTSTTVGDRITFSGVVTCENGFSFIMEGGASKVATFTGGINGPAEGGPHGMSLGGNTPGVTGKNNKLIFDCVINAPTFKIRSTNGSFEFGFKKQGNVWLDLYNDRTTVTCYGENVLAENGDIVFDTYYSVGAIDLNGYSQIVRNLHDSAHTGTSKNFIIKNSKSTFATLTVKGTQDSDYLCYLQGKLNLVWDPVGDYSFTVKDYVEQVRNDASQMTMSGTVTVKGGSFVIDANRAMPKLTGVAVEGAGRFVTSSFAAVPADGMSFSAQDTGVIDIPCAAWKTVSLTLDGTPAATGYYSGTQSVPEVTKTTHLGETTLFRVDGTVPPVVPVVTTWKVNAGNTAFSSAENWEGGSPDFTAGTAQPTFASGAEATVDGVYKIAGLTFGAADQTYVLAAGEGGELVFSQGVTTIPEGATVVVDSPVRFDNGHRFEMGCRSVLKFNGRISGNAVTSVSFVIPTPAQAESENKAILPVVHFANDENSFTQDLAFTNTCAVAKGTHPFGNGFGVVTFRNEQKYGTKDKILTLDGTTIPNMIRHWNVEAQSKQTFYAPANTTNVLSGEFDMGDKSRYMTVESGAQIIFEGGFKYSVNNFYYTAGGSGATRGVMIVRNKPMVFTGNANYSNGQNSNLRLECAGNRLAQCTLSVDGTLLTLAADDAITDTVLTLTKGVLDLNGHDVSFTKLVNSAATGFVKSATPASLTFTGNSTNTVSATFQGQAGLRSSGTSYLTLSSAQTSEGPLGVDGNGVLVLGAGASWAGTNVDLKASGTLAVDNPAALKRRTTVTAFGTDWKLLVPDGATAKVRQLIDGDSGEPFETGTYGGPNSTAEHKLANFGEGTGILDVTGVPGTCMIVR